MECDLFTVEIPGLVHMNALCMSKAAHMKKCRSPRHILCLSAHLGPYTHNVHERDGDIIKTHTLV